MVLYGPWENTAYPMFMHWSVSLCWLWNCNVVNQKASFLCTLYIDIYLYIVTVWYLSKCLTRRHFFSWIYLFSFYMQIDCIHSVCLKKPWPPAWSTWKAVTPLYQFPIFSWPHYLFAPSLEINNDRFPSCLLTIRQYSPWDCLSKKYCIWNMNDEY